MAKTNKADMSCARVKQYTASDVSKAERHNERKNETYENMNVIEERIPYNVHFKKPFASTYILDYIAGKYPDLVPLYDEIYNKHNRSYFEALEVKAEEMAKEYDCPFVDNEMPYGRVPQGHPVIVDYFYHEEIRGTENTGKRNR